MGEMRQKQLADFTGFTGNVSGSRKRDASNMSDDEISTMEKSQKRVKAIVHQPDSGSAEPGSDNSDFSVDERA
jgi:hypothetical protein